MSFAVLNPDDSRFSYRQRHNRNRRHSIAYHNMIMSDSIDRVFVHALNTVKRIPRAGTVRPPVEDRLRLYGLYKQSMEGDVEGIMDRPIGNTSEVHAECEKWDAWYAQQGLSRTDAKRRYITTLINTMHRYASQTPEALELVAELEFVWDQVKSNFVASPVSSSHSHSQSHPHQSVGVPPFPGAQHQQQIMGGSGSASGSRSGSGRYRRNNHGHKKHAGKDLKLRVLSPVSQPDEQYQRVFRFPNEHGGADYEDVDADVDVDVEGQEEQFEDDDVHPDEYEGGDGEEEDKVEEEPEDEEEEEYEEAPDGSYRSDEKNHSDSNGNNDNDNDNNDGDDGYLHQNRRQNPKQRRKRRALDQDGNDNGNGSEHAVTHQNNTTTDTNENTLQPRLWRRRVEQALTKMTAEVAAVREQMETRAVVQRRRNGVWAWFKWIIWVAVRQVIWDVGMLGLLLIYMRARGDRRVERRLRDGWAEVRARVMRLALLRGRLPFGL